MEATNGFEIAIVGMSCRFPDAPSVNTFWDNIFDGKDSIRPLTEEELIAAGQQDGVTHPDFVNSGSFLDDTDLFDSGLFGYSAKEADYIDPQHRVFLHVAWEALEGAGYINQEDNTTIGVFAGCSSSSYMVHNIVKSHAVEADFLRNLCYENNNDLLATRVAYKLNLTGPAVTIGTACSTSLVVVHQACQALLAGECDIALAGASRVSVPQKSGYIYSQGGILSQDGKCRAFDASASGTISGSGAGAIVLRRLEDAIADGDNILAVIKGTAINNDGNRKVGFTAPSVDGQQQVIVSALQNADVNVETISYVEAHGTATELGDPIEVNALTNAYQQFTNNKQFCCLGSVKSNIGHLDAAAGMAGMIKICGMFQRRLIPPSIHYTQANPNIDFEQSPFYVPTTTQPWLSDTVRRAGISAFGIGGTNAHLVLEEYTDKPTVATNSSSNSHVLLTFSANSKTSLDNNIINFREWCRTQSAESIHNISYTLATKRKAMLYRASVSVSSVEDAVKKLDVISSLDIRRNYVKKHNKGVALMFSGQGSQYVGMGQGLYNSEAVFKQTVDQCALLMREKLNDIDIRDVMFETDGSEKAQQRINQTQYAQPALFCFEYALTQWLLSKGIFPQALIGHSIGEYVAACVAEVMSLEDAISLVCLRGELMASLPKGSMIAVTANRETIEPLLQAHVNIAAINAENSLVLSGESDAIDTMSTQLKARGIEVKVLHTSHAFHSYMMDPCLNDFKQAFSQITLRPPRIPIISNLTGKWGNNHTITEPQYWIEHLRQPVDFYSGVQTLMQGSEYVLVEVGPGKSLSALAALTVGNYDTTVSLGREVKSQSDDQKVLYDGLGDLWCKGGEVNWSQFFSDRHCFKVSLPTYAFDYKKHWLSVTEDHDKIDFIAGSGRNVFKDWFYRSVWKSSSISHAVPSLTAKNIVFIGTRNKYLVQLESLMLAQNNRVFWAIPSVEFNVVDDKVIQFCPQNSSDYSLLFTALNKLDVTPDLIVHGLQPADIDFYDKDEAIVIAKFHSLLDMANGFNQVAPLAQTQLCILTINMSRTCYADEVDPVQSLILGPCKTIGKEFTSLQSYFIDVQDNPLQPAETASFDVMNEISYRFSNQQSVIEHGIALRAGQRLIESQEPITLEPVSQIEKLKTKGVYLITGSYGGIGATIAQYLASEFAATLILVSRRDIPEKQYWSDYLSRVESSQQLKQDITFIQALEASGATVFNVTADVSNSDVLSDKLNTLVNKICDQDGHQENIQCGKINGIFHCAGVADSGLIQTRDKAQTQRVFAAKVLGTQHLINIASQYSVDFFLNCSSVSAYLGPVGQVAYCSANNYQQAMSEYYRSRFSMLSIAWDAWQEVGMAVDSLTQEHALREDTSSTEALFAPISHGITPSEGINVIKTVLSQNFANILVSTRPLAAVKDWTLTSDSDDVECKEENYHSRPPLSVEYIPPSSPVQQRLCDIWQKRLGVSPIGIDDDFFELYGHSLLAMQIVFDIKQALSHPLPSGALYDYPTVRDLSELIESASNNLEANSHQERITLEL